MNHVMLDIETLGDQSNSIITSIGAIQFDIETGKLGERFHNYISIQSSHDRGLKMNPSTILWWLEQSDAARAELIDGNKTALDIVAALFNFGKWIANISPEHNPSKLYVWGRGPRFDMGILADAYWMTNMGIPWDTRKELCVRTMEFLNPVTKKLTTPVDKAHGSDGMGTHNALLDCEYQIKYVCTIFGQCNFLEHVKKTLS